jgi:hypothetical protein
MTIPDCPYRIVFIKPSGGATFHCKIGLNFCDVGEDGALCRTCRVPVLVEQIACQYLDVSAVLRPIGEGQWGVKAHLYCDYKQWLSDEATCITCPIKISQSTPAALMSVSFPADAGTPANTQDIHGGNRAS